MAENCTHDCSTCSSNCGERKKESLIKPLHKKAKVKKVIAVASGKGGVGKSLVSALLAARAERGLAHRRARRRHYGAFRAEDVRLRR